ncbi:MAG: cell division protein FtsQ/DivIB [Thermoanaerobaculaceae bacterium]
MRRGPQSRGRLRLFFATFTVVAAAAVLGYALQIQRVKVEGVQLFDPQPVTQALEEVVGKSPLWASAQALREKVLAIPWVDDAQVAMELDGTVVCHVKERQPAAVLADASPPQFVDRFGRILGPAENAQEHVQLFGFASYFEERQKVLRLLPELTALWGKPVRICQRLAARDLAITFAGEPWVVVVDPSHPEVLTMGKKLLAAWEKSSLPVPTRLDLRLPGRIFVQTPREVSQ